jgi:RNA recognition motif-containing protein
MKAGCLPDADDCLIVLTASSIPFDLVSENGDIKNLSMNIYVGNLDYRIDDEDLRGIFEKYGSVKDARIVMDKMSGRSKGFGFVVMDDNSEAQKAIDELSGATLEKRPMVVNEARPKKQY